VFVNANMKNIHVFHMLAKSTNVKVTSFSCTDFYKNQVGISKQYFCKQFFPNGMAT